MANLMVVRKKNALQGYDTVTSVKQHRKNIEGALSTYTTLNEGDGLQDWVLKQDKRLAILQRKLKAKEMEVYNLFKVSNLQGVQNKINGLRAIGLHNLIEGPRSVNLIDTLTDTGDVVEDLNFNFTAFMAEVLKTIGPMEQEEVADKAISILNELLSSLNTDNDKVKIHTFQNVKNKQESTRGLYGSLTKELFSLDIEKLRQTEVLKREDAITFFDRTISKDNRQRIIKAMNKYFKEGEKNPRKRTISLESQSLDLSNNTNLVNFWKKNILATINSNGEIEGKLDAILQRELSDVDTFLNNYNTGDGIDTTDADKRATKRGIVSGAINEIFWNLAASYLLENDTEVNLRSTPTGQKLRKNKKLSFDAVLRDLAGNAVGGVQIKKYAARNITSMRKQEMPLDLMLDRIHFNELISTSKDYFITLTYNKPNALYGNSEKFNQYCQVFSKVQEYLKTFEKALENIGLTKADELMGIAGDKLFNVDEYIDPDLKAVDSNIFYLIEDVLVPTSRIVGAMRVALRNGHLFSLSSFGFKNDKKVNSIEPRGGIGTGATGTWPALPDFDVDGILNKMVKVSFTIKLDLKSLLGQEIKEVKGLGIKNQS